MTKDFTIRIDNATKHQLQHKDYDIVRACGNDNLVVDILYNSISNDYSLTSLYYITDSKGVLQGGETVDGKPVTFTGDFCSGDYVATLHTNNSKIPYYTVLDLVKEMPNVRGEIHQCTEAELITLPPTMTGTGYTFNAVCHGL